MEIEKVNEQTISYDKLTELMNMAADEILDAADAPDVGTRDAVNLLVNVVLTRIKHPAMTLAEVVEDAYDEATLADVLAWINGNDGPDEVRRNTQRFADDNPPPDYDTEGDHPESPPAPWQEHSTACDECGNWIPDSETSEVNEYHAESCSLNPANTV